MKTSAVMLKRIIRKNCGVEVSSVRYHRRYINVTVTLDDPTKGQRERVERFMIKNCTLWLSHVAPGEERDYTRTARHVLSLLPCSLDCRDDDEITTKEAIAILDSMINRRSIS